MSSLQAIAYQNIKDQNATSFNSEQESNNPKPTLLGLPGEIRNKIWRFSATHERIQLPQASDIETPFQQRSTANPAFGMLCTNKQIYEESHVYYWTLNTFFLPHGSLSHTVSSFGSIAPEHEAMIKHIGMHFSIADLTPEIFAAIESRHRHLPENYDGEEWADIAVEHLQELWNAKLDWLDHWPGSTGLQSIVIAAADGLELVGVDDRKPEVIGRDIWDLIGEGQEPVVQFPQWFWNAAVEKMEKEIILKVKQVGWSGLKSEAQGRGLGS